MDYKEMSHAQLVEHATAHEKYIDELQSKLSYAEQVSHRYREVLKAVLHAILRQTVSGMTHSERNSHIRDICRHSWRAIDVFSSVDTASQDLDDIPF